MSASPLSPTKRYIRPGVTAIYFLPTCVDYNNPTRTELDAGTDLSKELADVSGFTVTSDTVDTPDWGGRFTSKIPGMITTDDSSITFYMSSDDDDVRTVLPRDTTGFVVWMDGGDVPTQKMDVYPATVASAGKLRTTTDPAQIQISFTITDEPAEDVAIPAAV